MRIAKLWIINHKSLQDVRLELSKDMFTTIIGLNDAGKSTALKSIELFFDEKATVAKASDSSMINAVSNSPLSQKNFEDLMAILELPEFEYSERSVYVLIEFEVERLYSPEEIDALKPSEHLQWLLRKKKVGDSLFILKEFGPNEDSYFVCCDDGADSSGSRMSLWSQTETNLKALQKEAGIKDADIKNENGKGTLKKIERAAAIYDTKELSSVWSKYDFKKDKLFFPVFRYLDWNISTEQIDNLVSDALGPAISKSLTELQATVNSERDKINDQANTSLTQLYDKYSKHLPVNVTGLRANIDVIVSKKVTELFVEKSTSDSHVHISDQGEGIKRQIGLGLIRAIAEEGIESDAAETKYIWVFDEPETHLYPQAQRELATNLQQLSNSNFQVIISTHSINFVDRAQLKSVYKAELNNGYTQLLSTTDTNDALTTLGVKNSDFLFYDKFIAVEGPTEYHLLDHFHHIVYGTSLQDEGIRAINLGGKSNRSHYKRILEDVLGDYRKPEDCIIYLLDKDSAVTEAGVFLVGEVADFEDSLANEIWISLLENECNVILNEAEIDQMRSKIDPDMNDTKLHKVLCARIANDKDRSEYLKSKGEGLAGDLKKYITQPDHIPKVFKETFAALHQTVSEEQEEK